MTDRELIDTCQSVSNLHANRGMRTMRITLDDQNRLLALARRGLDEGWISVDKQMPEDGRGVLFYLRKSANVAEDDSVCFGSYVFDHDDWYDHLSCLLYKNGDVLCWRPMPEPPAPKEVQV